MLAQCVQFKPRGTPYLEIEAKSWEDIKKAISLLNLDPDDQKIFSTNQIYELKGINEMDYEIITFDKVKKKTKKSQRLT